jgi:hypothetical protein
VEGTYSPPQSSTTTTTTSPYGFPQPGFNPDAHLPSGSQSKVDINQGDTFDLNGGRQDGTIVVRGDKNANTLSIASKAQSAPEFHRVAKGDTLWDLCARYYDNPWMWPKLWSYNPQVQNPHWIYPGDQLRVRAQGQPVGLQFGQTQTLGQGAMLRPSVVPRKTVFLRSTGYIDDPKKDVWGELVGAKEERQLLTAGNSVYMVMRPGVSLRLGQVLSVFRPVGKPQKVRGARMPPGEMISFRGAIRVDHWDPKTRVARGLIIESLDTIERGAKVGPVGRRFDVVPPKAAQVDLQARVLSSLYPHEFVGQDQVVFVDRGENDGLVVGNRLFVLRRGDTWRRTLDNTTAMSRTRMRTDTPETVVVEEIPIHGEERKFPDEVIAELRVIRTHKYSALTVVVEATREVEPGDRAIVRNGY